MTAVSIEPPVTRREMLRVFAVCLDSAAVERARWLARQLPRPKPGPREVPPQIWKLDSLLAASPIRDLNAQDAAEADVLVIAISSLNQREPALVEWLNSLIPWKQTCRRGGLLVGLFGDEDRPAGELAWLVNELGNFSRQTGMRFLWQWMADGATQDTEWLEAGIEQLSAEGPQASLARSPEIRNEAPPAETV